MMSFISCSASQRKQKGCTRGSESFTRACASLGIGCKCDGNGGVDVGTRRGMRVE
jgi:hypothetical protein